MDDTVAERTLHRPTTEPQKLTEVPKGSECRLLGISPHASGVIHGRGHHRRGRHGRRGLGPGARRHTVLGITHRDREIFRRLMDLGLTRGCTFTVVEPGKSGPALIEVRGTRIALGHGLAHRLLVEVVGESR